MAGDPIENHSFFAWLGRGRRPILLAICALVYLVLAVFFPILNYEFVDLDTPVQLLNNPTVHGLSWANVKAILAGKSTTSSYYPVRALSYALDYTIWGLNPTGFKLTNLLVHLGNVLLVFWLVLRLFRHPAAEPQPSEKWWDALVAGFAASLLAIHPLVVEPVAWVPGREELLMVFWTVSCFHCYLSARGKQESEASRTSVAVWYLAAVFCCLLACLSNAVAAVVPVLLTTWDALTLKRPRWRRVLRWTAAFWILGIGTIGVKRMGDRYESLVRQMDAQYVERLAEVMEELGYGSEMAVGEAAGFSGGRLILVFDVFGRNIRALLWPRELGVSYEPVAIRGWFVPGVAFGLLACGLIAAMLWRFRARRLLIFGLLWFVFALGPTAQIMPHHIHRADRFLYLPLVGLAAAAAMAARPLRTTLKSPAGLSGAVAVGLGLVLAMTLCSSSQVRTWQNSVTMWENCVRIGPKNFLAHRILADTLAKAGEYDRAYEHFREALAINASNVKALDQFAGHLATCGDKAKRDYELAIRLASWAGELSQGNDPKVTHTLAVVHNNYAVDLGERGQTQQAVEHYEKAIQTDPAYAAPLFNLALLRVVCQDRAFRRPDEAVRLAERACQVAGKPKADELMILAMAYAETGRADMAVLTVEKAAAAAEAAGDVELAGTLRTRLKLFRDQEDFSSPESRH